MKSYHKTDSYNKLYYELHYNITVALNKCLSVKFTKINTFSFSATVA